MTKEEEDLLKGDIVIDIPVYQVFVKELTLLGLPRSLGVLMLGLIAFSAFSLRNFILTVFFVIMYVFLVLMVKFSPKFDPKILEKVFRFCFKKYINY